MPGIADVATEFEAFMKSWENERDYLPSSIGALANGFEGWLKFEFYLWLIRKHGLRGPSEEHYSDVGVEYKVALDQRWSAMDCKTKQCDLWIRDQDETRYHFIELKVPFCNTNKGKMFASASNDFWYMSRLKAQAEKAATGSVIIVGVNFEQAQWEEQVATVETSAGDLRHTTRAGGEVCGAQGLRWAVLTTHYPKVTAAVGDPVSG